MSAFLEATAIATKDGRYTAAIDPDWFIWGPFGGYLAALAMRAMGLHSTHRRPATLSCQYLNVGEAGPVEIEVLTRKSGRRAECLLAALAQDGKTLLEAQSWMVADELTGLTHDHARMPDIEPVRDLPHWNGFDIDNHEFHSPMWRHIERRLEAPHGRAGGGKPEWNCWVRLVESIPGDDFVIQAARAVLWMDMAPWNAVLLAHGWPTTHIAPTLDLTVQFQNHLYAPHVMASDWLLVATASPIAAAGLLGAQSTLWSEAGELLAVGTAQSLCVPNPRHSAPVQAERLD